MKIKNIVYGGLLPLLVAFFTFMGGFTLLSCRMFAYEVEVPSELK